MRRSDDPVGDDAVGDVEIGAGDDPRLRIAVVALVAVEAALLLAVALLLIVELVAARPGDASARAALGTLFLLLGLGVAICAVGVARCRPWARAPVLTWQLVQVAAALPAIRGSLWFAAAALIAASVLVVLLTIRPGVIPPRQLP